MGKKRINILDLSEEENADKTDKKSATLKKQKKNETTENSQRSQQTQRLSVAKKPSDSPKTSKSKKLAKPKSHSKRYQSLKKAIKRDKTYPIKKAVKLVIKSANAKFDESVDIDIIVKKQGLSGSIKLPHGTGKTRKIVIFDKKIKEQIKKGKANFDLLVAKPADMSKIAKYAKFLGPKGLMPNPKNKTISKDPEKTVKSLSTGKTHFKTEKKAPIIHMTIGKVSFGEKKLLENLEALIAAVNLSQIKKAVLSSTMGPGIKLEII